MARNYSNIALDTTLTAGVLVGDLTCVVASAAGWPAAPFAAVLDPGSLTIEEVVQVTLVAGTTFTITRGFDGTTAAAHSAGATVRHSAIAGDFTDLQAALLNVAYTNAANVFTLHNAFGANSAIDSGALLWPANTYSAVLALAEEMTTAGAVQKSAILSFVKFNPVSANTGLVYGIDAEVETTAGNVQTHGNFFAGIFGSVRHKNAMAITNVRGLEFLAANSGGATVTNVQGALVTAMASASSVTTNLVAVDASILNFTSAVTTNAYGVRVQAPSNSATIVNNYGLNIANISGGTTINRAIHTAGGEVRHLTGAAAVIGMVVQGFTSQSANLTEWQDVSANVLGSVSPIGAALFRPRDAVTNTVTNALTLGHESTGTPLASFGSRLLYQLESDTTADQNAAAIDAIWTTATHATRASAIIFSTVTAAGALTERLRIAGNGLLTITPAAGGLIVTTSSSIGITTVTATGSGVRGTATGAGVAIEGFTSSTGLGGNFAYSGSAAAAVQTIVAVDNAGSNGGTSAGARLVMRSRSSTTAATDQADWTSVFVVGTHASRTSRLTGNVFDTATREWIRAEASGAAPMIGFLGAAAVVRQTLSAAAIDPATTQTLANDLRTALINLGLAA